jgi:peptidoglycan/xylan/chitin deacetylase (PgdA/CDA1 family)
LKDQLLTGIFTCFLPASLIWHVKTSNKTVYITFDDGPIPDLTDEILEILEKYNAKATFFCVGENVKRYRDIYNMIIEKGHSTGNHTHRHMKGWSTNYSDYMDDIREAGKFIDSGLFRPPYGLMTYKQAKSLVKEFRVVMWSVLTRDFDPTVSEEECLKTAMEGVKPGSIIVFHDNLKAREKVLYALPRLLEHLEREGYRSEKLELNQAGVLEKKNKGFSYKGLTTKALSSLRVTKIW